MKKLVVLLIVIAVAGAFAVDPTKILIRNDAEVGSYIQNAVAALWPDCEVEVYTGSAGIPGFITALGTGTYDCVVWDGFMNRSLNASDYGAMLTWYTAHKSLAFDDWGIRFGASSPSVNLTTAMGVTYAGSYYTSIAPHYCWDTSHPYAEGITDWTLATHGVSKGTWGMDMLWSTADPVTGWTASETAGKGALFEAENGIGCVSGMFWYSMNTQYQDLMENILSFAWDGVRPDTRVVPTSLGNIKAAYK